MEVTPGTCTRVGASLTFHLRCRLSFPNILQLWVLAKGIRPCMHCSHLPCPGRERSESLSQLSYRTQIVILYLDTVTTLLLSFLIHHHESLDAFSSFNVRDLLTRGDGTPMRSKFLQSDMQPWNLLYVHAIKLQQSAILTLEKGSQYGWVRLGLFCSSQYLHP